MQFEGSRTTVTVETTGSLEILSDTGDDVLARVTGEPPLVLRFRAIPEERLVGLGERFVRLDQTGRRWEAAVTDLLFSSPEDTYCYVPLILSSAGYGVRLDTEARAVWDLHATDPDAWSVAVADNTFDLHLMAGPPASILSRATVAFGRPPLAPPWVFGVWKTTLSGTESALGEAQALIDEDIPVTACWTYDYYHPETNSGCGISGTYPRGPYDDLTLLTTELHDLGYRVLGYTQPAVFEETALFDDARRHGYLVSRVDGAPATFPYFNPIRPGNNLFLEPGAAYVDFTNPGAVQWFQRLLGGMLELGFDGWMQDMGEHVTDDARLADGATGAAARNRYVRLYHEAAYDVWSQRSDAAVFARSGVPGSISRVSAMWPGDQHTDWTSDRGLPSVLPAGPTAGLAGVVAWGPDIAGLADGRDGGAGGLDEELWIRWCQYGALTPIMRDHLGFKYGAGTPIDMWSTEKTRSTFKTYAGLHLSLFPYLYNLAREATETGLPILRALLLDFPEFEEAWTIADQYMLGPALLVAPVHRKGARTRLVWFPPGTWRSWWSAAHYEGPGSFEVPSPLHQIPLFVREGYAVDLLDHPERRLDEVATEHG